MHSVALIGAAALAVHFFYQRWQPDSIKGHTLLLLGVPFALGYYLLEQGAYAGLFSALFYTLFVYLSILTTSVVAYRLSPFHPLAKYPGPLIARVTRLWAVYKAYGRQQHVYYHELHEKYGEVVRTGPDHLMVRNAKAIPIVYGPGANRWHRGGRHVATKREGGSNMIDLVIPAEHTQRRKYWERAFTPTAVKDYEPMIEKRVSQLVSALDARKGQNIDLAGWVSFFAVDFMGDLAYDSAFNMLEKGVDEENFQHNLEKGVLDQEALGAIPWIRPFLQYVPDPPALGKALKISEENIIKRKAKSTMRKDIFFHLLDEDGTGGHEPLNLLTLVWESFLVLVAGSDTTAATLSNTFFYLLTNPDAFTRLRQELDENVPQDVELASSSTLGKLPYLNAVLNEAMRLQPAVPNGVQRLPPPGSGPVTVDNIVVPPGTTVQIPSYSIHRDPRYFTNPNAFYPERWIQEEKKPEGFNHNANAWLPFSYGPTACIGKQLAYIEMRLVVSTLVRMFEFEILPGWDISLWEKNIREGFVMSKGELPAIVTARAKAMP